MVSMSRLRELRRGWEYMQGGSRLRGVCWHYWRRRQHCRSAIRGARLLHRRPEPRRWGQLQTTKACEVLFSLHPRYPLLLATVLQDVSSTMLTSGVSSHSYSAVTPWAVILFTGR